MMRIALLALLFCSSTVLPLFGADPSAVAVTDTSFPSGGRAIHVDHYESAAPGRHPRILVLHGAGGMIFDGPEMRRVARALAESGDTVDVVHYFESTGTFFARDAVMQQHFDDWLRTVRDAVDWAAADSHSAVGIYGYSLGAFLAVAAASDNPHVAAVVEHAGGIWNNKAARIDRMPPVLIIHGRVDQRVPLDKYEEPLFARLHARGTKVARRIFAGQGHVFTPAAMTEVKQAAQQFFGAQFARSSSGKR